jgi:hypothetical protein
MNDRLDGWTANKLQTALTTITVSLSPVFSFYASVFCIQRSMYISNQQCYRYSTRYYLSQVMQWRVNITLEPCTVLPVPCSTLIQLPYTHVCIKLTVLNNHKVYRTPVIHQLVRRFDIITNRSTY